MKKRDQQENVLPLGFVYEGELVDARGEVIRRFTDTNIIPQAGIDTFVGWLRGTDAIVPTWYVGVYEGNYVPTSATTSSDIQGSAQESVAYSQVARPEWNDAYDGVQLVGNLDSRAEFTFTTAKRLYGGFLISNNTKGANGGVLLSIARFSSPQDVPAGSTLRLGLTITIIPAS